MSTAKKKVTAKKSVLKAKPFNKKNAEQFAEMLYTDRDGVVTFTKLCSGVLANGKDGKRTLHCAIGEAVFHFVNPRASVLRKKDDGDGATNEAINHLVRVAVLKNRNEANEGNLESALKACVEENDANSDDRDLSTYAERSSNVAKLWMENVVPLLK